MLSERSPRESMPSGLECFSLEPRHQYFPTNSVDDVVEFRDRDDAIVLLLCRDANTDVRFVPSVSLLRRCGDHSPVDALGDGLGVARREDVCTTCTESPEALRVCCDEEAPRLKRNIAAGPVVLRRKEA